MPAKHRANPKTQEIVYRVYRLSEPLRKAMRQKRAKRGQTVQEFIQAAVDELPRLVESLGKSTGKDFSFIQREKGMFSFLGLTADQAQRLRREHAVYMLDSSRINVAGVNAGNIDYLAASVAAVL